MTRTYSAAAPKRASTRATPLRTCEFQVTVADVPTWEIVIVVISVVFVKLTCYLAVDEVDHAATTEISISHTYTSIVNGVSLRNRNRW